MTGARSGIKGNDAPIGEKPVFARDRPIKASGVITHENPISVQTARNFQAVDVE